MPGLVNRNNNTGDCSPSLDRTLAMMRSQIYQKMMVTFFNLKFLMCVCVCMLHLCPLRPGKGVRFIGDGVTGSCEPTNMDPGSKLMCSGRGPSPLSHLSWPNEYNFVLFCMDIYPWVILIPKGIILNIQTATLNLTSLQIFKESS